MLACSALFYASFAKRLSDSIITPPMVFLGLGIALGLWQETPSEALEQTLNLVAEITLIIVLFSDAAMVKARAKPLASAARANAVDWPTAHDCSWLAVNALLLPDWPVWELALLAAILAPTDAALG